MIYIGIDSGTQSVKAIALEFKSGKTLATGSAPHEMIGELPPGHMEQHPDNWTDAADVAMRECLEQLGPRKDEVKAIGVSGQQHGLVVLDEKNEVIRPAKLWCDTSTTDQCAKLNEELGGIDSVIELAGNPILPGYTAPKILWLKENEPKNYRKVRWILLPHDYLNFWLTGEKRMEYGDASGTALFDVKNRRWCKPIIDEIDPDLEDKLPSVMSSKQPVGILREALREAWGLKSNPMVTSGGGDNMMGAIGTGNVEPGLVTASLGTSGTLYACSDAPVIDPRGEVAAFCDSTDRWLPLVCTMNVTVATEQVRQMYGWSLEEMEKAIAETPAGADGLLFLPYLNGERTPNLPKASGVLHGLRPNNMTPPAIARATMEGVTLGLAYGLQRLEQLGIKPQEIRITGGGSNSRVWRQICADVFGVPVVALHSSEGAALGAGIQAAWIHHRCELDAEPITTFTKRFAGVNNKTRCEPGKTSEFYQELLTRQTRLARTLFGVSGS